MSARRLMPVVLLALAALALAAATLSIIVSGAEPPRSAPAFAPAGQPWPDGGALGAAGLVEAESEQAAVGAVTAGTVARVAVTPGQGVRAGEALFALDSRAAEAALAVRRAERLSAAAALQQARAQLPGLRAALAAAEAEVAAAEARQAEAGDLLRSAEGAGLSISRREVTRRRNELRIAEAGLTEARGRLEQARAAEALYAAGPPEGAALQVAAAALDQARAAEAQAETALALLTVRAPFDGTVLQVNLRPGEYAAAGGAAVILGQLRSLRLRADIDAADIPRFRAGAQAVAVPLGDPGRQLPLRLLRVEPLVVPKVSLTGGIADRIDTRVLRVLYEIGGDTTGLYPGQQLDLFLRLAE